jgi:hypothetical protein
MSNFLTVLRRLNYFQRDEIELCSETTSVLGPFCCRRNERFPASLQDELPYTVDCLFQPRNSRPLLHEARGWKLKYLGRSCADRG